jgi:hypothetical protein
MDYHSALTVAQSAKLISLSAYLSHCLSNLFCIPVAGIDGESLYYYYSSRPPAAPHPVLLPSKPLPSVGSSSSTSVVTVGRVSVTLEGTCYSCCCSGSHPKVKQ